MKFQDHPVGTKLFHADRQTRRDRTKLTVTFCNFVSVSKNKQKHEDSTTTEQHHFICLYGLSFTTAFFWIITQ